MGEATVRISRSWSGIGLGGSLMARENWDIAIDGRVVGTIANRETVDVAVPPGAHTLRLGGGRHLSPVRRF
jgi:hypothetical protein